MKFIQILSPNKHVLIETQPSCSKNAFVCLQNRQQNIFLTFRNVFVEAARRSITG